MGALPKIRSFDKESESAKMKFSILLLGAFYRAEAEDKEVSSPIKEVDRFTKLMTKWSEEWIGANGRVGFYEKQQKVSDRLDRVRSSFRKNIVLCNPEYAEEKQSTDDEEDLDELSPELRGECLEDSCAVSQSFTVLRRFEMLLTTFVNCDHPNTERSMETRRKGLQNKLTKLKRVVLRGICVAYVEKNQVNSTNCKRDLSSDVELQYDEVIDLLTNTPANDAATVT